VIAPQRNDENMELCKPVEKAPLGSILCRQNVEEWKGLIIENKLARPQPAVKVRVRFDLAAD